MIGFRRRPTTRFRLSWMRSRPLRLDGRVSRYESVSGGHRVQGCRSRTLLVFRAYRCPALAAEKDRCTAKPYSQRRRPWPTSADPSSTIPPPADYNRPLARNSKTEGRGFESFRPCHSNRPTRLRWSGVVPEDAGPLAQLAERRADNAEAGGSSPPRPTTRFGIRSHDS